VFEALDEEELNIKVSLSHEDNLAVSEKQITECLKFLEFNKSTELDLALIKLLSEALREIEILSAFEGDLTSTSLNVRNIFEIYITSRHIFSDQKALENWFGQMHKDNSDINAAFKKLLESRGFDTTHIDETQKNIDEILEKSPYKSKGPFNLKTEATKYGYKDDYDFIYKLSSKLIHPSSMKVNGYHVLTENNNYLDTIIQTGVYFCQKLEKLASEIINKKGV